MVGWKLCEELVDRNVNATAAITVFGEEPVPAYDRVRLTSVLAGTPAAELELAPRDWYARNRIELVTGDPVVALDRAARTVTTRSGRSAPYDRLVLATGSRSFVPPIQGANQPGVFVYRTLDDLEAIRTHAGRCRRAAVIGGGLLGLEAAQALLNLGLTATVIERGSGLMARQLSPDSAALLARKVEALGVVVLFQRDTRSIEFHPDGGLSVAFANHPALPCDLVVIAAGIQPRQELAEAAGLPCGPRGGIIVDDSLTTADPHILAIGECAVHRGLVYGLAAPGYLMADVAAARLAGRSARFTGSPLSARLKLLGVEVAALGEFADPGDSVRHCTDDTYRELIFRRGRLVGAVVVGPNPEVPRLQDAIDRRRFIWPWLRQHFLRSGLLWNPSRSHPADWPAATLVCQCRTVSRGTLSAACAGGGCTTIEQLTLATGAGSVCGSCRPLLAQLVGTDEPATAPAAGQRTLVAVCLGAIALAALTAMMPPLALGRSVEHDPAWHQLLTDPGWRRVTGFTLLGLAAASLALSLRKRIARFAWGDFGWWRVLHTGLGLAGLAGLFLHTGWRLGSNFNRLLMLDFLALALIGALAGSVIALESRLDARSARRLRAGWTWAHIVLTWPLPVLLTFHVLSAYYF